MRHWQYYANCQSKMESYHDFETAQAEAFYKVMHILNDSGGHLIAAFFDAFTGMKTRSMPNCPLLHWPIVCKHLNGIPEA
jgi:hypothetical protein